MSFRSINISSDFVPEFVKVAKLSDVKEGKLKLVDAEGEEICLINSGGKIYAVQEHCTHEEGNLHEGWLEGKEIVCPLHQARFEVATGKVNPETNWAKDDLQTYEVKIEGDEIFVKI